MTPPSPQPRVGVGVFVLRNGRVLLGRRRGAHGAGTWALPGGHLEFGEAIEHCARREVLEETGLDVAVVALGPCTNDVFADVGRHYVTVFVIAHVASGEPQLREPAKCAEWRWCDWGDLPQPVFPPLAQLQASGYVPPGVAAREWSRRAFGVGSQQSLGQGSQQSLALVSLLVRDHDEAIAFFVGTLGFALIEDTFVPQHDKRWVVVAPRGSCGCRLLLALASNDAQRARIGDQTGGRVGLFLYTDDFARDHAAYRANGVVFVREPRHEPYGTVAVFRDLYGNLWDLLQPNDRTLLGAPHEEMQMNHVRNGFAAVRPYLHGPAELPGFVQQVFDAQIVESHDGGPTLLKIGDGALWIEAGDLPPDVAPWTGSVYVYVPDVDAVFARAAARGARVIAPPQDKPYGERQCGFVDAGGNTWWVASSIASLR